MSLNRDTGVVLVTGASGNLGRAVADAFPGRKLALVDRDQRGLEAVAAGRTDCLRLACDLLDAAAVQSAVDQVLQRLGPVGVLCNIAGGFRMGEPVHGTGDDTWEFLLGLNVKSVLHAARAVVPQMLGAGGGAIINVGAAAAARGGANMGAYAASKSAVARLTESMAAELREQGIQVNCVL
ncbi:MAG TPA: SDR family oxidoreductase, partial [Ramlibacter sp.]|nr:SDR family oxidoreductase [Ramlibacter sp.]